MNLQNIQLIYFPHCWHSTYKQNILSFFNNSQLTAHVQQNKPDGLFCLLKNNSESIFQNILGSENSNKSHIICIDIKFEFDSKNERLEIGNKLIKQENFEKMEIKKYKYFYNNTNQPFDIFEILPKLRKSLQLSCNLPCWDDCNEYNNNISHINKHISSNKSAYGSKNERKTQKDSFDSNRGSKNSLYQKYSSNLKFNNQCWGSKDHSSTLFLEQDQLFCSKAPSNFQVIFLDPVTISKFINFMLYTKKEYIVRQEPQKIFFLLLDVDSFKNEMAIAENKKIIINLLFGIKRVLQFKLFIFASSLDKLQSTMSQLGCVGKDLDVVLPIDGQIELIKSYSENCIKISSNNDEEIITHTICMSSNQDIPQPFLQFWISYFSLNTQVQIIINKNEKNDLFSDEFKPLFHEKSLIKCLLYFYFQEVSMVCNLSQGNLISKTQMQQRNKLPSRNGSKTSNENFETSHFCDNKKNLINSFATEEDTHNGTLNLLDLYTKKIKVWLYSFYGVPIKKNDSAKGLLESEGQTEQFFPEANAYVPVDSNFLLEYNTFFENREKFYFPSKPIFGPLLGFGSAVALAYFLEDDDCFESNFGIYNKNGYFEFARIYMHTTKTVEDHQIIQPITFDRLVDHDKIEFILMIKNILSKEVPFFLNDFRIKKQYHNHFNAYYKVLHKKKDMLAQNYFQVFQLSMSESPYENIEHITDNFFPLVKDIDIHLLNNCESDGDNLDDQNQFNLRIIDDQNFITQKK